VAAIRKTGDFDILIGGRAAIDGNMSATAVQVAALLDIPQISYVADLIEVNPDAKTIKAVRLLEKARETVTSTLPAMITVVKEINEPRYPSLIGIRKAARAEVPVWNLTDLGLDASEVGLAGSRVTWQVELPTVREAQVEIIEGPPAEAAKKLIDRLLEEKVI
jgi:electron transfer flavoprotein beta subunit